MMSDRFRKRDRGFRFNLEEVLTPERRQEPMDEHEDPYFRNPGAILGLFLIATSIALLLMSPIGHVGWRAFTQWLQNL